MKYLKEYFLWAYQNVFGHLVGTRVGQVRQVLEKAYYDGGRTTLFFLSSLSITKPAIISFPLIPFILFYYISIVDPFCLYCRRDRSYTWKLLYILKRLYVPCLYIYAMYIAVLVGLYLFLFQIRKKTEDYNSRCGGSILNLFVLHEKKYMPTYDNYYAALV